MSRTTSSTFKQAVFAGQTDEIFVVLLELTHADWSGTIRISSDSDGTTHDGNAYLFYPFGVILPDDQEEHVSKARLVIENVSRDVIDEIRSVSSSPSITIKIVLVSDPDTIEAQFPDYKLTQVTYDEMQIEGDLSIETYMDEPFPGDDFLPTHFPGLF